MKKIKFLILTLLFIPFLTGCDFIDNITGKDKKIEITYVYDGKTITKTYKSYTAVTFEKCDAATGYEFKGWSLTTNGTIITKNDLKDKTSVTLYPIISLIDYSITYNLDGGTNNSSNPNTYNVESELIINAPTKDEYAFVGWTTNTITEPISPYVIEKGSTGNIVLYANYVFGKVSVIFNYEGIETQIIDYGTTCTKPEDPYKIDDTFICWCTDDALENEFDFNTPITESITLYPNWASTKKYTLTIENSNLINTNHESGKKLPVDASINLSTDYVIEGYEFTGWYIDEVLVSKDYKYSFKMPNKNTTVTPMFNTITTYEYFLGSNTDLNIDISYITTAVNNYLYGSDIGNNYTVNSNTLTIKNSGLNKLKPGLHSFLYGGNVIINVFVKIKDKAVTNINVDYDKNYPYATLSFNEDEGYNYYYSIDGDEYKKCYDGISFDINKSNNHQLEIKCEDGTPVSYTIEAIPSGALAYINDTFTYQGETFDRYIDSEYDLKMILEYYICSRYPSKGGTSLTFSCYYDNNFETISSLCNKFVNGEMSAPYGIHYYLSYSNNSKVLEVELKSNGYFNKLSTSQERENLTTTVFLPSYRSSDFNDFAIEKFSKEQDVRSLYELENLNYGIKPNITDPTALEVYNKAKEILREYVDDYMTDFEKLKAIFDYLATYVTYDDVLIGLSGDTSGYASYTSYGALINGVAVCDGIASAYKILCMIEGIECIEVIGASNGGGHAWNKVRIGNAWFGVDATWSRVTLVDKKYVSHDYFMMDETVLVNMGKQHYEEARYVGDNTIEGHNIINTANCSLSYFDLMLYGKYDLIISSITEYQLLHTYLSANNVQYVELKLTNGLKAGNIPTSGSYRIYYANENSDSIYLVKK